MLCFLLAKSEASCFKWKPLVSPAPLKSWHAEWQSSRYENINNLGVHACIQPKVMMMMMMMMTMFQIFKKTFQVQVFHNFHHQAVVILTFEIFAVSAEVYLCDLRGEVRPAVEVVVPWWTKE